MRLLTVLTVFSFLNTYSYSAVFMLGLGKCPRINDTLTDFDINRYMGVWYEQYRYFIVPEVGSVCTRIYIKNSGNGSTTYEISFYDTWTEDYDTLSGTAKIEEAEGEGKYTLHFPDLDDLSMSYQVIDTDYDSYTAVASCNNKEGYYTRNVWIFTRDLFPSADTLKAALSALSKKKLDVRFLHKIEHHSNCSETEIDEVDPDPDAEYLDDVDNETDAEEIE